MSTQRVGSFISNVGSAVSSGLPTNGELERQAEPDRERSLYAMSTAFLLQAPGPCPRHGTLPFPFPAQQRGLLVVKRCQEPSHAHKRATHRRTVPQTGPPYQKTSLTIRPCSALSRPPSPR
jgi:hypothetical protein